MTDNGKAPVKAAATLRDAVRFEVGLQTLRTDLAGIALEKRIREALGADLDAMPENTRWNINEFATLITATRDIVVTEMEHPPTWLMDLQKMWAERKELDPRRLWEYRMDIPHDVMNEWRRAFNAGQRLFEVDPAELPYAMLTPEQKAEADTPGSPLISRAKSSRGK